MRLKKHLICCRFKRIWKKHKRAFGPELEDIYEKRMKSTITFLAGNAMKRVAIHRAKRIFIDFIENYVETNMRCDKMIRLVLTCEN
jgi:hypothetical protein